MATLGEAVLRITGDVRGLVASLGAASAKVKTFGAKSAATMKAFSASMVKAGASVKAFSAQLGSISSGLTGIASQAGILAVTLGAMFAPVIMQGANFERSMSSVKAVVQELRTEIDGSMDTANGKFAALSAEAQRLGATTRFSASQVAEAMKFLGQAGFTADQILQGTAATLDLAAAGALDLGTASDIASDIMTAFGLQAQDISRVADVLAATASNSNTNIQMLGEAFKFAAPLASTLGLTLEEVSASIGVLAKSGLKASTAGTNLSQMFAQLVKGGERNEKILAKYGLTVEEVNPGIVGMREAIRQLEEANISASDSLTLFGQRAARAAMVLQQNGVEGFDQMAEATENAKGEAADMAATMQDNVAGAFVQLKSAIEGINISIFTEIKKSLRSVIDTMTRYVRVANAWVQQNGELAATIASVLGKLVTLLGIIAAVAAPLAAAVGGFKLLVAAIAPVITVIGLLFTKVGLIVAAITAVLLPIIVALAQSWDEVKKTWMAFLNGVVKPFVKGFMAGLKSMMPVIRQWWGEFVQAIQSLLKAFQELWLTLGPILELIGQALGTIAGIVFSLFIGAMKLVVNIMTVIVNVYTLAADAAVRFGRAIGLLGKEHKTSAELMKEAEEAAKKNEKRLKRLTAESKKFREEQKATVAGQQEMVAILEKGDKIGAREAKRMAELIDKHGELQQKGLEATAEAHRKKHAEMKKTIELARQNGKVTNEQELEYKKLSDQLRDTENNLQRFKDQQKENNELIGQSAADFRAMADNIVKTEQAMSTLAETVDAVADATKAAADLEKELRQEMLKGIEATINKLNDERDARLQAMQDEMEIIKARRDAKRDLGEDTSEEDATIARLQRVMEVTKQLTEVRKREAIEKQRERERLAGLDDDIDAAKRGKRLVEAAKLEAQKLIEVESKKIDELYQLDKQGAARSKQRLRERASQIVQEAEREAAKLKRDRSRRQRSINEQRQDQEMQERIDAAKAAGAERLAKQLEEQQKRIQRARRQRGLDEQQQALNEEAGGPIGPAPDEGAGLAGVAAQEAEMQGQVTQQLGRQVRSVRDLFALYRAIAAIRERQEKRAIQAANKALKAEQTARKAQLAAAAQPGNDRLRDEAERREQAAKLLRDIATKRAGEGQLLNTQTEEVKKQKKILLDCFAEIKAAAVDLQNNLNFVARVRFNGATMKRDFEEGIGAVQSSSQANPVKVPIQPVPPSNQAVADLHREVGVRVARAQLEGQASVTGGRAAPATGAGRQPDTITRKKPEVERQMATQRMEVQSLTDEMERLEFATSGAMDGKHANHLAAAVQSLTSDIERVNAEMAKVQDNLKWEEGDDRKRSVTRLKNLRAEREALKKNRSEVRQVIGQNQRDNRAKGELDKKMGQLEDAERKLQDRIDEYTREHDSPERAAELDAMFEESKAKRAEVNRQIKETSENLRNAGVMDKDALSAELKKLIAKRKELQEAEREIREERGNPERAAKLQERLEDLQARKDRLEGKMRDLEEDIEFRDPVEVEINPTLAKGAKDRLQGELDAAKAELERLDAIPEEVVPRVKSAGEQVTDTVNQIEENIRAKDPFAGVGASANRAADQVDAAAGRIRAAGAQMQASFAQPSVKADVNPSAFASAARPPQATPAPGGAAKVEHHENKTVNDNRSIDMVVNNYVDVQEVQRIVADAIDNAQYEGATV